MTGAVAWYERNAEEAAAQYESADPETLHGWLADLLPAQPATVLDVGAGSGRDAAWLADRGYDVIAAEPSSAMQKAARRHHPSAPIRWISDSLPGLERTGRTGLVFDAILVSAVWMHLPRGQRTRAFRKLVTLLKPGGLLALSLRLGRPDDGRGMHPVDRSEIPALARGHGAVIERIHEDRDTLGRRDIEWISYALRLPDDGTGALPLLRHVILNDDKSSTYKLGLLRALCRMADGAAGLARRHDDEFFSVPLGLVALTWIRLYKPLLEADLPQNPKNLGYSHLGFVRTGFRKLGSVSNLDLRVGMRFADQHAAALHLALGESARTVTRMPARHITLGDGRPILPVHPATAPRRPPHLLVDEAYLRGFGEMLVPARMWQALQRHSVWIEPAIISEWSRLMQRYAASQGRSLEPGAIGAAMTWADPERDVRLARSEAGRLLEAGPLFCVWSGKSVAPSMLDLDHCIPWSVWPCSDLWNLMPTHRTVNQHEKRARLPGMELMHAAQDRIMSWWESAYRKSSPQLHERFHQEASSTLPGVQPSDPGLDSLFDSIIAQHLRLRSDQQVPEWRGTKYL